MFLSWEVKYDYLAENPAEKQAAKDDMPPRPSSNSGDQQFWIVEQRRATVDYIDERVREAIDEKGLDAIEEARGRALITVLAYSGVRGAEILADQNDPRRNGLRCHSVDLEAGTITGPGEEPATRRDAAHVEGGPTPRAAVPDRRPAGRRVADLPFSAPTVAVWGDRRRRIRPARRKPVGLRPRK
ncbi:hypothetical protein [Natronosalvus rutilus]|uniref:Uncharacterized protein n=1 Tax=Natronosalvus rutilus TaxID=2953753 RepID=A0A9E7NDI2_9EURY|nr:hypothetical protein [Natronosalvus rutilus]UTF55890.1 hypothetical protein NGM29_20015 [Natronosalvus rutilus]